MGFTAEKEREEVKVIEGSDCRGEDHKLIRELDREATRLQTIVNKQEEEIFQLQRKLHELQGNFCHFHIDNSINDQCALCGRAIADPTHLRSR